MHKTYTGFARRLVELRQAAGLSREQLAAAAGLNRQALVKLEQGVSEPHWPTVLALAKALKVDLNAFLVEGEPEPPLKLPSGRPAGTEPPPLKPRRSRGRPRKKGA